MREARHTTKGFFILSLVNGRLTLQRTPLKENNQILYDNRPSFEILSLIPYETSKQPRNPMAVHKLHIPAFFAHRKCTNKPWCNLGFGAWGRRTPLVLEVRTSFVLVPWGSRAIPAVSQALLWWDLGRPYWDVLVSWITRVFLVAAPTSPMFYQQMSCPFCHYQQLQKSTSKLLIF